MIPTYNNEKTLSSVIDRSLSECADVIVVNDGSTDGTMSILSGYGERIDVVSYHRNRGKGYALKKGLKHAKARGFRYAITLDSDGQHSADAGDLLKIEFVGFIANHIKNLQRVFGFIGVIFQSEQPCKEPVDNFSDRMEEFRGFIKSSDNGFM